MSRDLSIVIISFNTKELTRDCLNSLKNADISTLDTPGVVRAAVGGETGTRYSAEVWVVDNASGDGSALMIEKEFPWVNLIKSRENLGFSKANNLAIPHCQGRYILFLNSDTVVPKNTLPEMIRFMDNNQKVGASTCYLQLKDGKMDPDCHRGFPTPWASFTYFLGLEKLFPKSKLLGQYHTFYKPLDKIHEIDACAGAFMLVRKSALGEVGLWDEDFFFYGEDLDLCYRLKEKGYQVIFYPQVKVIHYKGASSGIKKSSRGVSKATRETKLRIKRASTEAMRLFYSKHYKGKYPVFVDFLISGGIFILTLLRRSSIFLEDLKTLKVRILYQKKDKL